MDVGLVCDACSALTPIGVPECTRCGAAVALDPRATRSGSKSRPPPVDDGTACNKCSLRIAQGTKFCPNCGSRIVVRPLNFEIETKVGPRPSGLQAVPAGTAAVAVPQKMKKPEKTGRSTLFFGGAMQAARAKLTLIRGDGEDGVSFTLAGQEHLAGRGECPISFPDDPFLSPQHANFIYNEHELIVRDEKSLNGVFVRISTATEIRSGGTVLVGEQVLTIANSAAPEDLPDPEGTYFSASIMRPAAFEVRQNLRGGAIGWVFRPSGDVATLGREGNDINFPDDPFISGHHAELRVAGGMLSVTDLGSRNGTFVRIQGERVLKHGDYVFLGQQLLRVEIV
jgi:pSer/pThr/pTyr-binding forkhead associated (FHA) protein/DNA-directed RNA polymerase subunit RPC12/RpoP